MTKVSFDELYRRYSNAIVAELRSHVPIEVGRLAQYYGMIQYHLGWLNQQFDPINPQMGKLVRPILCLACCESAGGDYRKALPAAAAVELLHNYTLIHDDIEDQSQERRHRPTVWSLWGEALAINAGDGLHGLSRLALLALGKKDLRLAVTMEVCLVFEKADVALCEGQHLDMSLERSGPVDRETYNQMIEKKTAGLISAAAHIGALIATGEAKSSETYGRFGRELGLAFQIQDDILGIWGSPSMTGKLSSDLYQRKKTLPVVYALECASDDDRTRLLGIFQQPALADEHVVTAKDILDKYGARAYCETEAQHHYETASRLIDEAGLEVQAIGYLRAIADFLLGRES